MNLFFIVLILIIIGGCIGIVYITYYNRMQYIRTKIDYAEGIIDNVLRERFDMLVRSDSIVKSVLNDNKEYFKEYIKLKDMKVTNFEIDRKLKEAFNILYKFRDDYPDLEKNSDLKEIFKLIKESDEKIVSLINYYNKNTSILNNYIRKFPSNFVSKFHHFIEKPFFDGKNMNDSIYNDFKL